ncbi:MAG: fumarate reductase subunit C [Gammaproteobacteria bacterium]|nr:fumarate reductase subunit C [Gammaproteobacteria bacterium]
MNASKPYIREHKISWYLARPGYIKHMAQELTSIFVGAFALLLLLGIGALASGEQAWLAFLENLGSPLMLGMLWLILLTTLYHSVSWFAVTPKAMPVQIGENFMPGIFIAGAHYLAWILVSLFILFIAGVF